MRMGAPTDLRGYLHEAVLYDSDEDFLGVVVPFLHEGVAVGQPCLVALGASTAGLVRAAVGDTSGLSFLDDRYDRPASVIRSSRDLFAAQVADGASQIRVVSEVPHPGMGAPWDGWARYEAAVNQAYAEFPLWGLCAYDTRITPRRGPRRRRSHPPSPRHRRRPLGQPALSGPGRVPHPTPTQPGRPGGDRVPAGDRSD
jgi:hypothetical protein